jgi:DNA invertase Pin-like site-specific DNA recombinase
MIFKNKGFVVATTGKQTGASAYLRVSSRAQSDAMQLHAIERAASSRGDELDTIYREKLSAKSIDRPALVRVRAAVRAGEIKRLYVYRLDRLSRSGIRDTLQVIEELRAAGTELVSVADSFDMSGPAADIVLAVMAWAAQMERQAIGERIASAIDRATERGRTWGRPSKMGPKEKARALEMKGEGRTVRQIAMALKVSRSIVGRALSGAKSRKKE